MIYFNEINDNEVDSFSKCPKILRFTFRFSHVDSIDFSSLEYFFLTVLKTVHPIESKKSIE